MFSTWFAPRFARPATGFDGSKWYRRVVPTQTLDWVSFFLGIINQARKFKGENYLVNQSCDHVTSLNNSISESPQALGLRVNLERLFQRAPWWLRFDTRSMSQRSRPFSGDVFLFWGGDFHVVTSNVHVQFWCPIISFEILPNRFWKSGCISEVYYGGPMLQLRTFQWECRWYHLEYRQDWILGYIRIMHQYSKYVKISIFQFIIL